MDLLCICAQPTLRQGVYKRNLMTPQNWCEKCGLPPTPIQENDMSDTQKTRTAEYKKELLSGNLVVYFDGIPYYYNVKNKRLERKRYES